MTCNQIIIICFFSNNEHSVLVYYRSSSFEMYAEDSLGIDSVQDTLGGEVKIRRNFPETWLWHMLDAG